nr:MerR family transcriptional regulator [Gemmatimonadaceae bacterium]
MSGIRGEPVQEYYSIGEVCDLTDLKAHVLRYWESQFRFINPAKNRSGNRVYARREIELILLVKHLLYTDKYTIEGARKKLDDHRRAGGVTLRAQARLALDRDTLHGLERELAQVLALIDGTLSTSRATDDAARATT